MDEHTYLITFDEISPIDANRYADELKDALLDATPDIAVRRKRNDPHEQDFGTTLVLVLGTPAVVTVATVIGNWLRMRQSTSLTFKTADKQIIVQNITSKNAVQLAQLLLIQKREER